MLCALPASSTSSSPATSSWLGASGQGPIPVRCCARELRAVVRSPRGVEQAIVSLRHRGVSQDAPTEGAADTYLLLIRRGEALDGGHGVVAMFVLGLDMHSIELERLGIEVVVLVERGVDHLRTHRAARDLHFYRETERSESLFER